LARGVPVKTGSRVLAAVSGGADSMALMHRLRSAPYEVVVAHIDHRLRTGSARDARFVAAWAKRWDFPCQVVAVNVRAQVRRHRQSVEEAARTLRYRTLARLAKRFKCQAVLTAHTADDQAETILMNFLRGAGPKGLAGMPAVRPIERGSRIRLVRPLLEISRRAVRDYARRNRVPFREDPSNRQQRFTRNFIRLKLIPMLTMRFPGVSERLCRLAPRFRNLLS
jgi:tRNA(Ile)-lysidine synthase